MVDPTSHHYPLPPVETYGGDGGGQGGDGPLSSADRSAEAGGEVPDEEPEQPAWTRSGPIEGHSTPARAARGFVGQIVTPEELRPAPDPLSPGLHEQRGNPTWGPFHLPARNDLTPAPQAFIPTSGRPPYPPLQTDPPAIPEPAENLCPRRLRPGVSGAMTLEKPRPGRSRGGPVDYPMLDYLAEVTNGPSSRSRGGADPLRRPNARDFVQLMERTSGLRGEGPSRVVTNAGGVNPEGWRRPWWKPVDGGCPGGKGGNGSTGTTSWTGAGRPPGGGARAGPHGDRRPPLLHYRDRGAERQA